MLSYPWTCFVDFMIFWNELHSKTNSDFINVHLALSTHNVSLKVNNCSKNIDQKFIKGVILTPVF